MELEPVVSVQALGDQLVELDDSPLVDGHEIVCRYHILLGIEIIQIAEDIARGVADLTIRLAHLLEDIARNADIGLVVGGRDPQTEHVGAVLLCDLLRADTVAQRFTHLAALHIEDHAVGQNGAVRSDALRRDGGEQGALEPSAVLVVTLKVQIDGRAQIGTALADSAPG